jgi:hypothetical protein
VRLTVEDFEEEGNPKRGAPAVPKEPHGNGEERRPDEPGGKPQRLNGVG